MSSDEGQQATDNQEPTVEEAKPKKVKKNLRVGKTAQERSYAASSDTLLAIAAQAAKSLEQRQQVVFQKDTEKSRRKELKEQLKQEKREARLQRKHEKLERLKKESSSTAADKKKGKDNKKAK